MALKTFINDMLIRSDQELIKRMKKGDEKALALIYKKYYPMVSNLVIRNSGSKEEALDVYQDAIVILWKQVCSGNFVLHSKLSTYLYGICQNIWRRELGRKKKFREDEINNSFQAPYFLDLEEDKAEHKEIVSYCLNKLDKNCKKILMYFYFEEMSMEGIANKLGFANADTAKSRKYKCKKKLDKLLMAFATANKML